MRIQTDYGNSKMVTAETDFYTVYSNPDGYCTEENSTFLETICDVWQENYFNTTIDDLMIRVFLSFLIIFLYMVLES